jgi:tetratricopeptide (TPR) repeat protein
VWQELLRQRPERRAAFLSLAVDLDPERVRPFATPHDFPTVVDTANALGRAFDLDLVPVGLLLDENRVIRWLHVGGFDVRRPEIRAQVEALLTTDFSREPVPALVRQESLELEVLLAESAAQPTSAELQVALGDAYLQQGRLPEAEQALRRATDLAPDDWSAAFALGSVLLRQGRRADGLRWWRRALALDPDNYAVRSQIWALEHPDRFYPAVDADWQVEQLAREGSG